MNRWMKIGVVIAGYALAFAASILLVALYDRRFSAADNQTMGGMIAGGEMIYACAIFGVVSLLPTGLALWFLRGSRMFWSAFSAVCLAFAIAGLAAVLAPAVTRRASTREPALMFVDLFGLAQMLGSPLWIAGCLLFAVLAPARELRRRLLVATTIELVIGAYALVHFLVPHPPI